MSKNNKDNQVEVFENMEQAVKAATEKKNKNKVGRPLKFKSVEELEGKFEDYVNHCLSHTKKIVNKQGEVIEVDDPLPLTVTGMAVALDTSRETLMNYQHKDEYFDTLQKMKQICEADAENRLYTNFTPGVIFSMKNNYGWKDKIDVETNQNVTISVLPPKMIEDEDDE